MHKDVFNDDLFGVGNKKYFDILQLPQSATPEDIRNAYKKLAKKHHPDRKGGSTQKFQQISAAYQYLTRPIQPQKKKSQNKRTNAEYGVDDEVQQMAQKKNLIPRNIGNLFQNAFKDVKDKNLRKVEPTRRQINVTLQNIYKGEQIKLYHRRARWCRQCEDLQCNKKFLCPGCRGKKILKKRKQIYEGIFQQTNLPCKQCDGQGAISEGMQCKVCQGKRQYEKGIFLDVEIPKGILNKFIIKIQGEGSEVPYTIAGDLLLIVHEESHPVFERKGVNLQIKKEINLSEALAGFSFDITHLDGQQHTITTQTGEVIGDGQKRIVKNLGMPIYKKPNSFGNLIVLFSVIMPLRGTLSLQAIEALEELLPGQKKKRPEQGEYEMIQNFHPANLNLNEEGGQDKEEQERPRKRKRRRSQSD